MRHVDAGYDRAREVAAERGVRIPMADGPEAPVRPGERTGNGT
jgi:urocanate hydratase